MKNGENQPAEQQREEVIAFNTVFPACLVEEVRPLKLHFSGSGRAELGAVMNSAARTSSALRLETPLLMVISGKRFGAIARTDPDGNQAASWKNSMPKYAQAA